MFTQYWLFLEYSGPKYVSRFEIVKWDAKIINLLGSGTFEVLSISVFIKNEVMCGSRL